MKTKRDKAFLNFKTKSDDKSESEINEMVIAIDPVYYKRENVVTMLLEFKRVLLLHIEYNYIQQCQENDLERYEL